MYQHPYEIITESIQINEKKINRAAEYAKYKVGDATLRSRQTATVEVIDNAILKLGKDRAAFKKLPKAQQELLLKKARRMKALKKAGKMGAAIAIATGIIAFFNHKKNKALGA